MSLMGGRPTNVVGIFPDGAAIVRFVGSQLRDQQEEWQLVRRRFPPRPKSSEGSKYQ